MRRHRRGTDAHALDIRQGDAQAPQRAVNHKFTVVQPDISRGIQQGCYYQDQLGYGNYGRGHRFILTHERVAKNSQPDQQQGGQHYGSFA